VSGRHRTDESAFTQRRPPRRRGRGRLLAAPLFAVAGVVVAIGVLRIATTGGSTSSTSRGAAIPIDPLPSGSLISAVSTLSPGPSGSSVGPSSIIDAPQPPGKVGAGDVQARQPAPTAGNPIAHNPVPIRLVRIEVSQLKVSAPVVDVAVDPDGALQIPENPAILGRWAGGAEPGEPFGSVVVVGHVDDAQTTGALFALHTIKVGATVVAVGADGRSFTYRVSAVREVAKTNLVSTLNPFAQQVGSRLVLITCGGAFDETERSYADNVVVFAEPIEVAER